MAIIKTDDEKDAQEWRANQRMLKAMRYGYKSHSFEPGHKSLTKCSCFRSPKQRTHKPDWKPTTKFKQMLRRNMLRSEAR